MGSPGRQAPAVPRPSVDDRLRLAFAYTCGSTLQAQLPLQGGALRARRPAAVEKIGRLRRVEVNGPIYVDARDKSAGELFDLIAEEAERRGSAGGVTFNVRAGPS